jgi:O-antigen ligase
MIRKALLVLGTVMVLVAPFREGGRDPAALFLVHSLVLAYVMGVILQRARPADPGVPGDLRSLAPVFLPMGLGLALAAASALVAAYPFAAGLGFLDLFLPCLVCVAAAFGRPCADDLRTLRLGVVVSSALQSILALRRYPGGGPMAAGASFLNPNHLAAFLNLGFFLCAAATAAPGARSRARLIWGGTAVLHLAALGVLQSRGAFLALLAGSALLAWRIRLSLTPRLRAAVILSIGLIAGGAGLVLHGRFAGADDPYRYHRLSIWKASLEMIREHPILGFGPGSFPHVSPAFNFPAGDGPVRYGRTFREAHSAWLTLMAEAGGPAALCFAIASGACLLALMKRGDAPDEVRGVASGVGLAILVLLVQAAVEDLQDRPALTIIPALLAGTALSVLRRPSGPERPSLHAAPRARLLAALGLVYLFVLSVLLPFLGDREARIARSLGREGLPRMRRAALLVPIQPEYHHDLAMALLNSGPLSPDSLADAQIELLEAERLKPLDYRFPLLRARLEARAVPRVFEDPGAGARALDLYDRASRLAPLDPRPRVEMAALLVDLGRRAEALGIVREALRIEPAFVRARIMEGSLLLDLGRRDEARAALAAAGATLAGLPSPLPEGGYAREILADARSERERLESLLGGPATAGTPGTGPGEGARNVPSGW